MKRLFAAIISITLLFWAVATAAQSARTIESHEDFGDYRVTYTVFNSDFIPPDVARNYNLVRARDRAFVNISVTEKGGIKGMSAGVSGTATNLIQQSRSLPFQEIRDQDAVYYLAPFRFENEESLTFNIDLVLPDGSNRQLTFRRQLHKN
ncbi:DUF4426 domain-containing protein [Microbulbifer bruguierae]|uniref:DUF4426 domain-containing protein n=1 Tax=Microbulbifer bruguierae TaxID=3029061 RepID=A0ABY8N9L6_9GAMM|nr:DUF4426 domain-containing protein [Microbulbifer bruguierae]WGL15129.1 DUF4426 domain-containing protein [Microbulbifer bruguierae]